jgi:CheY-like chemotaxis protein
VKLPEVVEGDGQPRRAQKSDRSTPVRRRILVVDDNVDAAESLALLLQVKGHDVEVAHDGPTAIKTAEVYRPDVVLLDIGLPRMDGYQVARKIREQSWGSNALVVALTGYGREEDRQRSAAAGFNAHLVKPADLQSLSELMAQAKDLTGPVSPS